MTLVQEGFSQQEIGIFKFWIDCNRFIIRGGIAGFNADVNPGAGEVVTENAAVRGYHKGLFVEGQAVLPVIRLHMCQGG